MFRLRKKAFALTLACVSFYLIGCGRTIIMPMPQASVPQQTQPNSPATQPKPPPLDGQIELLSKDPDPKPMWVNAPDTESTQQYVAFKGRSRNAAQAVDAEDEAFQSARLRIANFLFTHVNSRVKEVLKSSGVASDIYDPQIIRETVRELTSDVFVRGGRPAEFYTEYLKRFERRRWVHYYQVQVLVKFPQEEIAVATQDATRRALERLKATTAEPDQQQRLQQGVDTLSERRLLPLPLSPAEGDIWSILVGIDRYDNLSITPLNFASRDVQLFAQALAEVTPQAQLVLMTHEREFDEKPTHTNVIFQLERLVELIQPDDTFILVFSGHSMTRDSGHYLLTVNSDPRSVATLKASSVSIDQLRGVLKKCRAKQVVLCLDGCRNDPQAGKGDGDNLLTAGFAKDAKRLVVEPVGSGRLPQKYAGLFACSVGERAYEWEEKQQGVFSYFLSQGFRGDAADSAGRVTVTSLAAYLQQKIGEWSRKTGNRQNPWFHIEGQPPMVLR